jgi:hypothetical protein
MKSNITSALLASPHFTIRHDALLGPDDGFRRFLASSDHELDATSPPSAQPVRFLDSVPPLVDTALDGPVASLLSVQESLSRALGSALLMAARPTEHAPSLSDAVRELRASLS